MTKEITRLLNRLLSRRLSRLLSRLPGRLPAVLQICSLVILFAGLSTLSISCRSQPPAETIASPSAQPTIAPSPPYPLAVVGKPYPGRGVVTLINLKEGWIEINHEPIAELMPAMQMEWSVKDPALLRQVKVGDTVEFVVVENGKGELITELKKAEAPK
jgi:Cu/Ag efflux protein CusF